MFLEMRYGILNEKGKAKKISSSPFSKGTEN